MYSEMKTLACRFTSSYHNIFQQVGEILQEIQRETAKKIRKISDKIIKLKNKATHEAKKEARKLEEQKEALKRELEKYKVRNIIIISITTYFSHLMKLNFYLVIRNRYQRDVPIPC